MKAVIEVGANQLISVDLAPTVGLGIQEPGIQSARDRIAAAPNTRSDSSLQELTGTSVSPKALRGTFDSK